jgi:hypothetical protein
MRIIVKRRTIRPRNAVSAQRYLDSYLELVLGGLRNRAPTEAPE